MEWIGSDGPPVSTRRSASIRASQRSLVGEHLDEPAPASRSRPSVGRPTRCEPALRRQSAAALQPCVQVVAARSPPGGADAGPVQTLSCARANGLRERFTCTGHVENSWQREAPIL